jgi:PKD repeat protein
VLSPQANFSGPFPLASPTGQVPVLLVVGDGTDQTTTAVTVLLSGTGSPGSGSTVITPAPVYAGGPLGGFTTATAGLDVTFAPSDAASFVSWDLLQGGTTVASSTTASWAYSFAAGTSGSFTVRQHLTGGGTVDTVFRVNRAPVAAFTFPAPGVYPQTVAFTDTSTDDSGVVSRSWTFGFLGSGWTSTSTNPTFTFTNPGTYSVSLTVTDADGRSSTVSHPVVVQGSPPAPAVPTWSGNLVQFDAIPGVDNYKVSITFTGTYADGSPCVKNGTSAVLPASGPFSRGEHL